MWKYLCLLPCEVVGIHVIANLTCRELVSLDIAVGKESREMLVNMMKQTIPLSVATLLHSGSKCATQCIEWLLNSKIAVSCIRLNEVDRRAVDIDANLHLIRGFSFLYSNVHPQNEWYSIVLNNALYSGKVIRYYTSTLEGLEFGVQANLTQLRVLSFTDRPGGGELLTKLISRNAFLETLNITVPEIASSELTHALMGCRTILRGVTTLTVMVGKVDDALLSAIGLCCPGLISFSLE